MIRGIFVCGAHALQMPPLVWLYCVKIERERGSWQLHFHGLAPTPCLSWMLVCLRAHSFS